MVKDLPANARDTRDADLIPELERSPGEGNGNPLQYFCEKFHVQRSPAGYNPGDHKKSDTTEGLSTHTHFFKGKDRQIDGREVKEKAITKSKVKAKLRENLSRGEWSRAKYVIS